MKNLDTLDAVKKTTKNLDEEFTNLEEMLHAISQDQSQLNHQMDEIGQQVDAFLDQNDLLGLDESEDDIYEMGKLMEARLRDYDHQIELLMHSVESKGSEESIDEKDNLKSLLERISILDGKIGRIETMVSKS